MDVWRVFWWLVRIISSIGLDIHVVGRQNVPAQGACIIASTHLSWVDVPLIPAFIKRRIVYMAKEETFQGNLAWLVRFLGPFPVKRGQADPQSIPAAHEQLKPGRLRGMFPEGTHRTIRKVRQAHA